MHWHLLSGLGPFVGAIVVWGMFRPPRRKSFGGTYPALAWAMLVVPAVTMGLIGIANPYALGPHLFGCYVSLWIAAYSVLEEAGYVPRPFRYVIVGFSGILGTSPFCRATRSAPRL